MAKKIQTNLQKLSNTLFADGNSLSTSQLVNYRVKPSDEVVFRTTNPEEYKAKLLALKQQRLLNLQWKKAGIDNTNQRQATLSNILMMYRDADLMDTWPEIGAALDTYAEEACCLRQETGTIITVHSESERAKRVLEDLIVNRLDIHILGPMIVRAMCKYGNDFMLLNIDSEHGIMGWKQLPIYEINRLENGTSQIFATQQTVDSKNLAPGETKFVWSGHNEITPYRIWQIAHFRLITDSLFLPYGVSILMNARRHWRMLSMAEDAMLLYRLERSISRRIFKIYVGAMDAPDVKAMVQNVANEFKRAPIIDPETGQLDLRKAFPSVDEDYFIPTRGLNDNSSIETLNPATNPTTMEDIKYLQTKILAALRIPRTFLNFQDVQGRGQNLSMLDIRFARVIMRIQQAFLMELNKVCIIHLHLLGLDDEVNNFTLTMNNPSLQMEDYYLQGLQKKVQIANMATQAPNGGLPLMSWHMAMKKIMGFTDSEIEENLNEIRVERAAVVELQKTSEIIQKTGLFDKADRAFGTPGAKYQNGKGGEGGSEGGGGAMGGGMADFGGGDMGDMGGGEPEEDLGGGEEGAAPGGEEMPPEMAGGEGGAPAPEEGPAPSPEEKPQTPPNEALKKHGKVINETVFDKLLEHYKRKTTENKIEKVELFDKNFLVNEELDKSIKDLTKYIQEQQVISEKEKKSLDENKSDMIDDMIEDENNDKDANTDDDNPEF